MNNQAGVANRRSFLRLLGGTVALTGFGQAFGQGKPGLAPLGAASLNGQGTKTALLNLAATAEALTVCVYHHALSQAQFAMQDDTRQQLALVLLAEQGHLELLSELGGRPLTRSFKLPAALHTDARCFAETSLQLEQLCTGAYLTATHEFAGLGQPELAATAAQLGASEAQHLMVLSQVAGFGPRAVNLPDVPFRKLSDASPTLLPFIEASTDGKVNVELPTARQVSTLAQG